MTFRAARLHTLPWFLVLGLPVAGALIVIVARRLLPGDGGSYAAWRTVEAADSAAHVPGVVLAASGTLSFGAILGPELPVIALGSAVGVVLSASQAGPREAAVLANAGAFSAISALFGGPLVAGMLLIEADSMRRGAAARASAGPRLGCRRLHDLYRFRQLRRHATAGLTVPNLPPYTGVHLVDLVVALAVGLAAVVAIFGAR